MITSIEVVALSGDAGNYNEIKNVGLTPELLMLPKLNEEFLKEFAKFDQNNISKLKIKIIAEVEPIYPFSTLNPEY